MRNRILSITRSNIPYVKELHPLTGSVIGCLVMQQLDYWFMSQPEGFYKFLEPADHPAYKEGDSWVEELAMSREEFRYAFDRIATRYKSRTEYQKASKAGDPFKGKFYCSFVDRRANLTYYFRNHAVVDAALDRLLYEVNTNNRQKSKAITKTDSPTIPEAAQPSVTDCSESEIPVGGNPALQRWKSGFTEVEIPLCRGGNPALQESENPLYVNPLFRGPLLQRLHTETTTTTGTDELSTELVGKRSDTESIPLPPVSELPRGCGGDSQNSETELIWPTCSIEDKTAITGLLSALPLEQHQLLLDEIEGARSAGTIRIGLVPFAGGLARAMLANKFTPGHAPRIANRRREQATNRDQIIAAKNHPEISSEDLARGRAALARITGRTQTPSNQLPGEAL